ncbi:serine/threonine protein kinase [Desulfocastanea catecholica]
MEIIEKELGRVKVIFNGENELVTIEGNYDKFECIGVGSDAAVFRFMYKPHLAFKVYSIEKINKIAKETEVYLKLGHSEYFPQFYGSGSNFLILSYEEGITLYDCLLKGIHIPETVIQDVENARNYAFKRGLNPRDIHLKNILLHEGRAKILDVSEYMNPGNDKRWEYLTTGYHEYYSIIDGKALPHWLIETVRKWYNQKQRKQTDTFNVQDFVKELLTLFRI